MDKLENAAKDPETHPEATAAKPKGLERTQSTGNLLESEKLKPSLKERFLTGAKESAQKLKGTFTKAEKTPTEGDDSGTAVGWPRFFHVHKFHF